jgi:hypothetical protein
MKKSIVILACLMVFGCVTTKVNNNVVPDGCKITVEMKKTTDIVLPIAVTGIKSMALVKPDYYALAHLAAIQMAALLRSQPVSLKDLTSNKLLDFYTPLLGLLPMDQVLCKEDREYLANYLLMI